MASRFHNLLPAAAAGICLLPFASFASGKIAKALNNYHRPAVQVTPDVLDMGRVAQGYVAAQTVMVRNTGSTPLTVDRVATSCGCTSATFPKSLAPGSEAALTVRFDSANKGKQIRERVNLFFTGHTDTPTEIMLRGDVTEDFRVTPPALLMGDLRYRAGKAGTFTIERLDGEPLQILSIQCPPTATAVVHSQGTFAARLDVDLTAQTSAGSHEDQIIVHTNHPQLSTLTLPIDYAVLAEYKVEPQQINFGSIMSSAPVQMRVEVTGADTAHLRVVSAPDGMDIQLHRTAARSCVLLAKYTPRGGTSPFVHAQVVLATANPRQPNINIPFYAAIQAPDTTPAHSPVKP